MFPRACLQSIGQGIANQRNIYNSALPFITALTAASPRSSSSSVSFMGIPGARAQPKARLVIWRFEGSVKKKSGFRQTDLAPMASEGLFANTEFYTFKANPLPNTIAP